MTTPAWQAPINGLPGNLNATDASSHLNQFLSAHAQVEVYDGNRVIASSGGTQLTWLPMSDGTDYDQPITMSGTTIGRVQLPLLPYGNGANVLVSLYPDNGSGAPNTSGNPLASVSVPAAYINNVAASEGLENATMQLTNELNNEYGFTGNTLSFPWLTPAGDATGSISSAVLCTTSDSMLFLGGINGGGTGPVANCASTTAVNGTIAQPVPQPSLPQATEFGGAAVVNESTVVYLGGSITGTAAVANVWAASWNPGTHAMGSWSAQPALPAAVQHSAVTSWGNTIYSVGGADASNNPLSVVYFSSIVNSQVTSWQTSTPLPIAVVDAFAVAVQGFLFVMGGHTNFSSTTGLQNVYWAKINSNDGSLGPWQTGPNMPNGAYAFASGWDVMGTQNAVFQIAGRGTGGSAPIQTMSVTENGPSGFWYITTWANTGDNPFLPISLGDGQYTVYSPLPYAGTFLVSTLTPMPYISVPLYATGLTSGAKYHVVLQAVNTSSASDGMQLGTLDDTALPAVALQSNRHWGAWSNISSGYSVPLRVYDASVSSNRLVRHLVEDQVNGMYQRWSSLFYGVNKLAVGLAETTMQPNLALNSNPTFTSGVTPWTATNGTITQSNAQTHGGFAFSGLLTPTGGFATASASSELFPVQQTFFGDAGWLYPSGWFYTPTTWSNFSLSVNWFDSSQAYISTSSSNPVTLAGATWTFVSNYFQPPATAAYGSIVPTMSGSPGSGNTLFMSDVFAVKAPETVGTLCSVATVDYTVGTLWPPVGVTQLN